MSGIIFLKTRELDTVTDFYTNNIGMEMWLSQKNINILKHGNMIIGFQQSNKIDRFGLITFFYNTKKEVDNMYKKFNKVATTKPTKNPVYNIYNFFSVGPEGRKLEFQTFLHPTEPYLNGAEMLKTRRSIRKYKLKEIPEEVLWKVFELCKYSPTSRNSQSYYYLVIEDPEKVKYCASIRGKSSVPIVKAPIAVAICVDTSKTKRPRQDGDIAAYHFMLAAKMYGLGTCWIADMDRDSVKECLDIPKDHYVATVTPLGYPKDNKAIPKRRDPKEFVDFIE